MAIDIKDLLLEEFVKELNSMGIEPFRAGQVFDWVYKKFISDFNKMTNIPAGLQKVLQERFYVSNLNLVKKLVSKDGTEKFLFMLDDGEKIETAFIPSKKTRTVCVSSQVGCKFACKFCASGKSGFLRNLRSAEMIDQILFLKAKEFDITNVVFMGIGEPLDNYENVLKAIKIINAPYGLGIGQRRITVSTCGIVPAIERLGEEGLQIELSVSLHSPKDNVRSDVMSVNNKFPIKDLIKTCKEYSKKTNRQVTFEYILIKDINDSIDDAKHLAGLIKRMLAKVNLIVFNPVKGSSYLAPDSKSVKLFKDKLDKQGVIATLRFPRGADIEAACGQLRLGDKKIN